MSISNVVPYNQESMNAVAFTTSSILVTDSKNAEVALSMPHIVTNTGTEYQLGLAWETDSELSSSDQLREIIFCLYQEITREPEGEPEAGVDE